MTGEIAGHNRYLLIHFCSGIEVTEVVVDFPTMNLPGTETVAAMEGSLGEIATEEASEIEMVIEEGSEIEMVIEEDTEKERGKLLKKGQDLTWRLGARHLRAMITPQISLAVYLAVPSLWTL